MQLFEQNIWENKAFDRLEDFYAKVHNAFDPYLRGRIIDFSEEIDQEILDKLVASIYQSIGLYKKTYLHGHEDDIEMRDTISADEEQFNELASLIANRNFATAVSTAWGMDTLPRDYIPQDVWNFLTDYAQYIKNRDSSKMEMPL